MKKWIVVPVGAAMLLTGSALAQSASSGAGADYKAGSAASSPAQGQSQQSASSSAMGASGDQLTSDKLLDMKVVSPQGENIGEVEKLVISPQNGQISEVIVSVGGFLGIGDKKVALPWNQVQLNQDKKQMVTPATKQQLEQAQAWHDPSQQQAKTPDEPAARGTASPTPPTGSSGGTTSGAGAGSR